MQDERMPVAGSSFIPHPRPFGSRSSSPFTTRGGGCPSWSAASGPCRSPRKSSSSTIAAPTARRDILARAGEAVRQRPRRSTSRRTRARGRPCARGSSTATGDVVIVQDADLGIRPGRVPAADPADPRGPGRRGVSARGSSASSHRVLYFWHSVANKVLTTLSNMFTNLNLTDMETCYKVFRREVLAGHDAEVATASASSRR